MEQQTLRKTYKYKLIPTPTQERELGRLLGLCRSLYNTALEQRITAWQRVRVTLSRYQQEAELKEIRAAFPEYAAIHSHVLQDVLARLDKTYQAFFRRLKAGEKAGFPRYQGRDRYHSFTCKEFGNGATVDNGFLVLAKIGRIAVRWSRPLEGTPKTVTISREADGWYVCFSCADVPVQPVPETGEEIGVDLGIEAFATLSDGVRIFHPGWYRKAERALKTAQRRVSRRKKGSHRRRKAVQLLAKAHQRVRRQRQDFHHKTALALVRESDVIYHEDLRVANMAKNHHLAKSISDAGWAAFLSILAFKAACAGKRVQAVHPAFTSQRCSGCGVLVHKGLSVRWHSCPDCGISLHRDHNAARNIERAGQALRGGAGVPASENRESVGL
jgi:putative transposase